MKAVVFAWVSLLTIAGTLNGAERLVMRVSPSAAMAPAWVTVQATVEADSENRALEIIVESNDFFRSSMIQLDGQYSPRVNLFQFPNLPVGRYQVTGIVAGSAGRRATATGWLIVSGRQER